MAENKGEKYVQKVPNNTYINKIIIYLSNCSMLILLAICVEHIWHVLFIDRINKYVHWHTYSIGQTHEIELVTRLKLFNIKKKRERANA